MAHKIDGPGATADLRFTEGSPSPSGYVAPTQVTADWANMVQEEFLAVLAAAGIAPDKADNTQVAKAVARLLDTAVAAHNESDTAHEDIRALLAGIEIPNATEAVAGIIRLATQAQVLAGAGGGAVTPETLAAAVGALYEQALYKQNGYQIFPPGPGGKRLILQWGYNTVTVETATQITLPIAWPTGYLFGACSAQAASPYNGILSAYVYPNTITTIRLVCDQYQYGAGVTVPVYWFVVGY